MSMQPCAFAPTLMRRCIHVHIFLLGSYVVIVTLLITYVVYESLIQHAHVKINKLACPCLDDMVILSLRGAVISFLSLFLFLSYKYGYE